MFLIYVSAPLDFTFLYKTSFQEPDFYKKHRWEEFGHISCNPEGASHIFMKKYYKRSAIRSWQPLHCYALPSAFIRSYLAFKSSAGVGPIEATGADSARRTGGIGFPTSTRFSHMSRISPASRSSSFWLSWPSVPRRRSSRQIW